MHRLPLTTPCRHFAVRLLATSSLLLLSLLLPAATDISAQTPAAATAATPATPDNAATFLGDWTLSGTGANGPVAFQLTLKTESGKVLGDLNGEVMGRLPITDITRSGSSLILKTGFYYQNMSVSMTISLVQVEGRVNAVMSFADGAYQIDGVATRTEAKQDK